MDMTIHILYKMYDFLPNLLNYIAYDNYFYYGLVPFTIFTAFFSLEYVSPAEHFLDDYINGLIEILGYCFFWFFGLYIVICSISFLRLVDTSETYQLIFPFLFLFFLAVVEVITYFWWKFLEFYIKKFPEDELTLFVLPWKNFFDYQSSAEADENLFFVCEDLDEGGCWLFDIDFYISDMIKGSVTVLFCIIFYFCTTDIFGTGYGFVPYYW